MSRKFRNSSKKRKRKVHKTPPKRHSKMKVWEYVLLLVAFIIAIVYVIVVGKTAFKADLP